MNFIKNLFKKKQNRNKWPIYKEVPDFNITQVFVFSDQRISGGHIYSEVVSINGQTMVNGVVNIYLNKRVTEESIIHTINHECLHAAINGCIMGSQGAFAEKVINQWMLEEYCHCEGYVSKVEVKKTDKKHSRKKKG